MHAFNSFMKDNWWNKSRDWNLYYLTEVYIGNGTGQSLIPTLLIGKIL